MSESLRRDEGTRRQAAQLAKKHATLSVLKNIAAKARVIGSATGFDFESPRLIVSNRRMNQRS